MKPAQTTASCHAQRQRTRQLKVQCMTPSKVMRAVGTGIWRIHSLKHFPQRRKSTGCGNPFKQVTSSAFFQQATKLMNWASRLTGTPNTEQH